MHLGLYKVENLKHTPNSFSIGFLKYLYGYEVNNRIGIGAVTSIKKNVMDMPSITRNLSD